MAKVLINDTTLSAIGNAIRTKNGEADTYKPSEMPQAILNIPSEGYIIDSDALVLTGNCAYFFNDGAGDWMLENLGQYITTNDVTSAENMFSEASVQGIPFDLNLYKQVYNGNAGPSLANCFKNCANLTVAPKITHNNLGLSYSNLSYMFYGCTSLTDVTSALNNMTWDSYATATLNSSVNMTYMFYDCKNLRSIPEDILKKMRFVDGQDSGTQSKRNYMFHNCYRLDELKGVYLHQYDDLSHFCNNTYRLKDFICCEVDENVKASDHTITIDLSVYVGYAPWNSSSSVRYGASDKEMKDDTTYQALKDDPDAWTKKIAYSRYNRGSAIRTIASLPDNTITVSNVGTCSIKFKGDAGSATDEGAINTMTEEEIAVATEKGWTVAFA